VVKRLLYGVGHLPKSSDKKSGKKGSKGSKKPTGPLTAAGLIRFYEEVDVGVKIKPHILVILALVFTLAVIILSKFYGG